MNDAQVSFSRDGAHLSADGAALLPDLVDAHVHTDGTFVPRAREPYCDRTTPAPVIAQRGDRRGLPDTGPGRP